ncbi:MAG TPA: hypothetical protein PLV68_19170, partial [Ilumatobacteraceae bacterium]|nr:hypothetical protein [Ilumatobacteraceae bacterium]
MVAIGGMIGALVSGNVADFFVQANHPSARISVAGISRIASAPFFLVAFSIDVTAVAIISLGVAAMFLVAGIPPTNAARADVLHPNMRGRGASFDAVAQSLASAASPI